jgi:hypothetical protein
VPCGTLQLKAELRAIARCSLPIEVAAHRGDAAPSRRLRAISIMIGVILSGGRTRSRHVLSAGTWFAAPLASTSGRELRRFTSGQTELGPPAEEPAVAMP